MGPACQLGKKEKEKEGGLVYWAESGKGRLGLAQEARLGFSDRLDPRLVGPARFAGSGHGPSAPSHSLSYRLGGETRARGSAFQARGGVDKVGKRAVARLMVARHIHATVAIVRLEFVAWVVEGAPFGRRGTSACACGGMAWRRRGAGAVAGFRRRRGLL